MNSLVPQNFSVEVYRKVSIATNFLIATTAENACIYILLGQTVMFDMWIVPFT